jgi:hypothetical protein
MKILKSTFIVFTILFIISGCQTGKVIPGLYWEQITEIITPKGDTTSYEQKFYLIPEKFRSERIGPHNDAFLIVRLDKEIMINGSPAESMYQQIPFAELIRRQELRKKNLQLMRAQMDTLPPNLRWRMEKDLGVRWEPERYEIKETGEKKVIAGLNCEKLFVTNRDSLEGEYWVTKDVGSLDTYGKDWLGIMGMVIIGPQFEKHKLINEKGVLIEAHVGKTTIKVTKMEKKSLPENIFDPPESFEKIDVPVWNPPQSDSSKTE